MTDIHGLENSDRIVFSNGHESPVVGMTDIGEFLNINFIAENKAELNLYFTKETGEAPGTNYEIVKVISNGSN